MADCERASLPLPAGADDRPQTVETEAAPDQTDQAAAASEQTSSVDRPTADTSTAESAPPPPGGQTPSSDVPPAPDATAAEGEAPLSKRKQKRLAKREAFLAQRPALRRAERQRRKEKRAAVVAAAVAAGTAPPKRPRLVPMATGSDVGVVIDLSFDELMTERDLGKCLKQVQRCYAANRRAARPVQLILTSMDGESRRLMDANDGWQNWDVRVEQEHLLRVLQAETITYLTSDSEHELDTLLPGRVYVIGGLVDHNHHKGECLRRAREAGISHARLPIDHFVEMKTRKVLTIDHVFSILLRVAGGSGWQEALQQVLPARKGAVLKEGCGEVGSGVDSGAEEMTEKKEAGGDETGAEKGDGRAATEPVMTEEAGERGAASAVEPADSVNSGESVSAEPAGERSAEVSSGQTVSVGPGVGGADCGLSGDGVKPVRSEEAAASDSESAHSQPAPAGTAGDAPRTADGRAAVATDQVCRGGALMNGGGDSGR